MDRTILLWSTTTPTLPNTASLTGHKSAVLDLHWSRDSRTLFSASADTTLASWDVETGARIRRHIGHEEVVNSVAAPRRGEEWVVSGSDDGGVGVWDPRAKGAVAWLDAEFPVTAVAVAEAGNEVYSGGIDNDIRVWDLRKRSVAYRLLGHADTVTSLEVSPDSQYLLSNAHDSTVRMWDIRPFAPVDRAVRVFDGAPTGIEKNLLRASWSPDGKKVAAGSGDRTAVVWETASGKMLHKLPGHKGAVNDVRFSPTGEPLSKFSVLSIWGCVYLELLVALWDLDANQCVLQLRPAHLTGLSCWANLESEPDCGSWIEVIYNTTQNTPRIALGSSTQLGRCFPAMRIPCRLMRPSTSHVWW